MQGVENGVLGVGEKRMAGELIGVPQGEIPIFNAFYPEKSWGDKIRTQVPFGEEKSAGEEVIKEEDTGDKKGQTRSPNL